MIVGKGDCVTFTAAGQIKYGDPQLIEENLVYLVETEAGTIELHKPSEFLRRFSKQLNTFET